MVWSRSDSAHPGDAEDQRLDELLGHDALEPRQALALEHRLQFVRRPGQQDEHAPGVFDPLAGRRAAIVGQHFRAFDDQRLALVDFRHRAAHLAEALLDRVADLLVEDLPAVERSATASRVTSSSVGPRPPLTGSRSRAGRSAGGWSPPGGRDRRRPRTW